MSFPVLRFSDRLPCRGCGCHCRTYLVNGNMICEGCMRLTLQQVFDNPEYFDFMVRNGWDRFLAQMAGIIAYLNNFR